MPAQVGLPALMTDQGLFWHAFDALDEKQKQNKVSQSAVRHCLT